MEKTEKGRGDFADDVHPERSIDLGLHQHHHFNKDQGSSQPQIHVPKFLMNAQQQIIFQQPRLPSHNSINNSNSNNEGSQNALSQRDQIDNELQPEYASYNPLFSLQQYQNQHAFTVVNLNNNNNNCTNSNNSSNGGIPIGYFFQQQQQVHESEQPKQQQQYIELQANQKNNNQSHNSIQQKQQKSINNSGQQIHQQSQKQQIQSICEESLTNASIADEQKNNFIFEISQQQLQLQQQQQQQQMSEQKESELLQQNQRQQHMLSQQQQLLNSYDNLPHNFNNSNNGIRQNAQQQMHANANNGFRLEMKSLKQIHSMTEKKNIQEKERKRQFDYDAFEQMDSDCMSECAPQLIPKFTYCVNMPQNLPREQSYEALRNANRAKYMCLVAASEQLQESPVVSNYKNFLITSYQLAQERPEECAHLLLTLETQFDLILHVSLPLNKQEQQKEYSKQIGKRNNNLEQLSEQDDDVN